MLRVNRGITFKHKGNEKQFRHNEEVLQKFETLSDALESTPPAIERAKEALKEGEKLILYRQKLIRIADRSEFGWATVQEYEDDELAENSDDEKKLFKSEFRANRKMKADKNKRKKDLPRRDWRPRYQPPQPAISAGMLSAQQGSIVLPGRNVVQGLGPCCFFMWEDGAF